jgi:hypothetical protein
LIVLSLVLGGLAPARTTQAAKSPQTASAVGNEETQSLAEKSARPAGELGEKEAIASKSNDAGDEKAGPVWVAVDVYGPASVGSGQEVNLRAAAMNVSNEKASGVRLEVREETGAKFVGPASYPLPDLDPGQQIEVVLKGQVNARPGDNLHVVVQAAGGNLSLEAGATSNAAVYTAMVRQDEAEEWRLGPGAGVWRTGNGRLEIDLPADRDERIVRVYHRGVYEPGERGQGVLFRFELQAEDANGQSVEQFDSPITLRWRYTEALAEHPPLIPPLFAWWNPTMALWEPLPTRVDDESGAIETEVNHFSTFGTLSGIHEAAEDPFSGLDSDAFTGSLSYHLPLPLLTRPGGFAPALALNYNSRRRDTQQNYGSADSLVGFGWRMDGIDSINYVDAQPTYALSLGGATYTVRRTAGYSWYALEAPAIQITRESSDEDAAWYVYTPDGRRYAFGKVQQYVRCENNQVQV